MKLADAPGFPLITNFTQAYTREKIAKELTVVCFRPGGE